MATAAERRTRTAVARRFKAMDRKQQRDLLNNVCQNMLDNEAWDVIALLLIEQLGEADAWECVKD